MCADLAQPERPRVFDQDPQHPSAAGQVADDLTGRVVYAAGEKPLELPPLVIQDSQGGVFRLGELGGRSQDLPQQGLEVELADKSPADIQQSPQAAFVELTSRRTQGVPSA
jgi:hypothetical protein